MSSAIHLRKKRRVLRKSLLFLCLSVLSSCSRGKQVIGLAQNFFSAYDRKDFKLAYSMLSPADRRSMSADSFFVMSRDMEDQIVRLDSSRPVSTVILRNEGNTTWVEQVWRVPDYTLIRERKPQDVKFSEFFASLESEKEVPVRLDSSRTVCLVKEQGHFYVYLGLDRFKKFAENYRIMLGAYSFLVVVEPEIIRVYKAARGSGCVEASVRITNYSPFLVTGFLGSVSIDGHLYEPRCSAFEESVIPSGQSIDVTVRISLAYSILKKCLRKGSSFGRIEEDRVAIIPTKVYFDKTVAEFMRKISMKRSGFAGFKFLAPGYSKLLLDF